MTDDCALVAPLLEELALGVLSGDERARAMAHIESCSSCSSLVTELSAAADQLLYLAPPAEPPLGFELRLLQRMRTPHPRRRPRMLAAGLAAAAVVAAFVGGIVAAPGHSAPNAQEAKAQEANAQEAKAQEAKAQQAKAQQARAQEGRGLVPLGQDLEAAQLVAAGRPVGRVMVYAGNPTWVFMYMDDPAWTGALRCQVVEDQGPVLTLGEFWLSAGKGAWAASVQQPAGRLREARVVNSAGRVLAVALMKGS